MKSSLLTYHLNAKLVMVLLGVPIAIRCLNDEDIWTQNGSRIR
jgi:hypothetical protein